MWYNMGLEKILSILIALAVFFMMLGFFIMPYFNSIYTTTEIKDNSELNINSVNGTSTNLAYGDLVLNSENLISNVKSLKIISKAYNNGTDDFVSTTNYGVVPFFTDLRTSSYFFVGIDGYTIDKIEVYGENSSINMGDGILRFYICSVNIFGNNTCDTDETKIAEIDAINVPLCSSGGSGCKFLINTSKYSLNNKNYRLKWNATATFERWEIFSLTDSINITTCINGINFYDSGGEYNFCIMKNMTIYSSISSDKNLIRNTNYTIDYGLQSSVATISWINIDINAIVLTNITYNFYQRNTTSYSWVLLLVFFLAMLGFALYFLPRR